MRIRPGCGWAFPQVFTQWLHRLWRAVHLDYAASRCMCLAVPGKLLSVEGEDPILRTGRVNFGGIVKEANLSCVPEAKVGDYVIVHVGLAISVLDESEACDILEHLRLMGELEELEPTKTSDRAASSSPSNPSLPPGILGP